MQRARNEAEERAREQGARVNSLTSIGEEEGEREEECIGACDGGLGELQTQ
jgi:hypothetical protein